MARRIVSAPALEVGAEQLHDALGVFRLQFDDEIDIARHPRLRVMPRGNGARNHVRDASRFQSRRHV